MTSESARPSERGALAEFLDLQRAALLRKVQDLDEASARRRPSVSSLSLLALLKHSTMWEERWFQGVVAGRALADGWPDRQTSAGDEDFVVAGDETVEQWATRYQAATAEARSIVRHTELDQPCARTDVFDCNLRWVMLHLIEETARHAGHADIIRESLDGTCGR